MEVETCALTVISMSSIFESTAPLYCSISERIVDMIHSKVSKADQELKIDENVEYQLRNSKNILNNSIESHSNIQRGASLSTSFLHQSEFNVNSMTNYECEVTPEKIDKLQQLLGSEKNDKHDKLYKKWESMTMRNLETFMQMHRSTFIRRFRRSVPHEFRWEAWKAVSDFNAIKKFYENNYKSSGKMSLYESMAATESPFSNLIRTDIPRTFPELNVFDYYSQNQLFRILNAYSNYAPDVGYCQGMNFITGLLLLVSNFNEEESFWVLAGLMKHYDLNGFYVEDFPLLKRYVKAFDILSEMHIPLLRRHFNAEGVSPPMYLHQWFLTLFVTNLPLKTVVVVWDYLLCEGIHSLLALTIGLLKTLESFLIKLHFEDIMKFLKSLKSNGLCDDAKIGKMLVKKADTICIPTDVFHFVTNTDCKNEMNIGEEFNCISPTIDYCKTCSGDNSVSNDHTDELEGLVEIEMKRLYGWNKDSPPSVAEYFHDSIEFPAQRSCTSRVGGMTTWKDIPIEQGNSTSSDSGENPCTDGNGTDLQLTEAYIKPVCPVTSAMPTDLRIQLKDLNCTRKNAIMDEIANGSCSRGKQIDSCLEPEKMPYLDRLVVDVQKFGTFNALSERNDTQNLCNTYYYNTISSTYSNILYSYQSWGAPSIFQSVAQFFKFRVTLADGRSPKNITNESLQDIELG